MKPLLTLLGIALLSSAVQGAVAEGENLLINGRLDADQVDFPEFWSPSPAKHVLYDRVGGPEGKMPAVILKGDEAASGTISLRQQGMTLVAGETYKLSAYLKTQGFHSRSAGLIIHNSGWLSAVGITQLPADSDWTFLEKTFTLMPSKNDEYGLALYAINLTGEIHVADIKLEAVSQRARESSRSQASLVAAPRLVPLQPLLNKIPRANPELTFQFFSLLPEPRDAYECLVTVGGDAVPPQVVPIGNDGAVRVRLAGLGCGDYSLRTVIRHRQTQTAMVDNVYPVSVIDAAAVDRRNIRPLNNLVAEVLNQPVSADPAPQSFTFVNPRDGWVFVALSSGEPAAGLAVRIGDGDSMITAATDRLEAFRELPAGEHRITVSGNDADARLVVRSIPEIFASWTCRST